MKVKELMKVLSRVSPDAPVLFSDSDSTTLSNVEISMTEDVVMDNEGNYRHYGDKVFPWFERWMDDGFEDRVEKGVVFYINEDEEE